MELQIVTHYFNGTVTCVATVPDLAYDRHLSKIACAATLYKRDSCCQAQPVYMVSCSWTDVIKYSAR